MMNIQVECKSKRKEQIILIGELKTSPEPQYWYGALSRSDNVIYLSILPLDVHQIHCAHPYQILFTLVVMEVDLDRVGLWLSYRISPWKLHKKGHFSAIFLQNCVFYDENPCFYMLADIAFYKP